MKFYEIIVNFIKKYILRLNNNFEACQILENSLNIYKMIKVLSNTVANKTQIYSFPYIQYLWIFIYWLVICGIDVIALTASVIQNRTDGKLVCAALGPACGLSMYLLKLMNMKRRQATVESHINSFKSRSNCFDGNIEEVAIIQHYEWKQYRDVVLFLTISIISLAIWASDTSLYEGDRGFPLLEWYPFDTSITPVYQLIYFKQIIAMFPGSLGIVSIF